MTDKLQHGPGEQLRRQIDKSSENLNDAFMTLILIGPWLLCASALPQLDWIKFRFGIGEWIFTACFIGVLVWGILRAMQSSAKLRRLRQGLDAELMTAQLLLPLITKNCMVFHDIPAGGFNLDHVVIGPYAVFMVETKSRRKPGTGKQSAQVSYDGKALHFPDHVSSKSVDQARNEARWLAQFLRGAAGETVPVVPVVALPGWFVSYGREASRSDVIVINPKMLGAFVEKRNSAALSDSLRIRIAYALTQRYPALP